MKNENSLITEKLKSKEKFNDLLKSEKEVLEDKFNAKISDFSNKYEEKNKAYKELQEKYEILEKENKELVFINIIQ